MDKELTYDEALAQLEELVTRIEDPARTLNALSEDLKRAMELVKYCKECLKSTETSLTRIIED